jgi:hypothetical protein
VGRRSASALAIRSETMRTLGEFLEWTRGMPEDMQIAIEGQTSTGFSLEIDDTFLPQSVILIKEEDE